MAVQSAWKDHPDYWIHTKPIEGTIRVWHGDLVLAESRSGLLVLEKDHVDRLYIPEGDVHLAEFFEATDFHTVCPFKGEANYWTLRGTHTPDGLPEENVVWGYPGPFEQVAPIAGHVCFYDDRVRIEIEQPWSDGSSTTNRFPIWGDAADLLGLIDVTQVEPTRFTSPAYHDVRRNVVEAGHQLAQAIVAASKQIPGKRVTSASMLFPKAARFDEPLDLDVEVLRDGRSFSTLEVRVAQGGSLRSVATLLMDVGAPDLMRHDVEMPDIGGPMDAEPLDMWMTGRELRVVDGAYDPDPDRIGPPVIHTWARFRNAPSEPALHSALLAQSTTHWTIAAAMRPHPGIGEAQAHKTLSTGIMAVNLALHDEVDVTQWLLYSNPAIHAGGGRAQGEGHVFTQDGRLVASYTVQAMIRELNAGAEAKGVDPATTM
jgi:acyl-CoA thioesterase II